ncbi:hypothetical protein BDV24DRAFT_163094 [Aspergillus arachidicola]|uniref:Uncharacterized protein n=1 Tax=Aspergillus arachidicola TaxID=656916 RepID=A0A5N6YE33_9EURO|nr:hypothetical protein BDV24DRAFT_163094 [Aspergillus arachidicola]
MPSQNSVSTSRRENGVYLGYVSETAFSRQIVPDGRWVLQYSDPIKGSTAWEEALNGNYEDRVTVRECFLYMMLLANVHHTAVNPLPMAQGVDKTGVSLVVLRCSVLALILWKRMKISRLAILYGAGLVTPAKKVDSIQGQLKLISLSRFRSISVRSKQVGIETNLGAHNKCIRAKTPGISSTTAWGIEVRGRAQDPVDVIFIIVIIAKRT